MDNASVILLALDAHLDHPVRLVLYGRAALQLGFNGPPTETAQSKDVDAIVPLGDMELFSNDDRFWDAQDMSDIEFLIRHDRVTPEQIEVALNKAAIPDLVELRDAFDQAKLRVRELALQAKASLG